MNDKDTRAYLGLQEDCYTSLHDRVVEAVTDYGRFDFGKFSFTEDDVKTYVEEYEFKGSWEESIDEAVSSSIEHIKMMISTELDWD